MGLHDLPAESESESCPGAFLPEQSTCALPVDLSMNTVERLEYQLQLILRDPRTGVLDLEQQSLIRS